MRNKGKLSPVYLAEITYPESPVISIGVDCLKLRKGESIDDAALLRSTKKALRKYPDNHSAAIALTSILALIAGGRGVDTIRNHIEEIVQEINDVHFPE